MSDIKAPNNDLWAGEVVEVEMPEGIIPPALYNAYKNPEVAKPNTIVAKVCLKTKTIYIKALKND